MKWGDFMGRAYGVVRPTHCPVCHKLYQLDWLGRCVHCKTFLGFIKW